MPLAAGTDDDVYLASLGVATFHNDPISDLAVTTVGFRAQGELVAQLALCAVIVQEGGYDVDAIGDNVRAFLLGM